jgi:hypothetical protein
MKHILFALAACATLASLPAPAAATPTAAAAYEGGRCIVAQDRRAAVALLARLPLGDTPADLSGVGRNGAACVASLAGASSLLMRGAIVQAMFLRDFRGLEREPADDRVIVNLNLPVEAGATVQADRTGELYRWGDCVARNDAAAVERLLRAPIGSAEERDALGGLQTFMSSCMPAGQQLSVRSWEVRSLFAQAAYHMLYRYWTGQLQSARR